MLLTTHKAQQIGQLYGVANVYHVVLATSNVEFVIISQLALVSFSCLCRIVVCPTNFSVH
jgi:hypothetical protein